jgi:hypothetical protein
LSAILKKVGIAEDPAKAAFLAKLGDLSWYEIGAKELLTATYLRPEKTSGGIILTARNLNEDIYQSKAHLVLKMGPQCEFFGFTVNVYDWVVFRPSDTWPLEIDGVHCRHVFDRDVRARIQHPERIW